MINTPLYDAIKKYADGENIRFHTPGHQGVFSEGLFAGSKWDVTELPFSDNLLYPRHVIKESERLAAEAFGSTGTLFVSAGATVANFIAVGTVSECGRNIILNRNAHKSVYAGIRLFGLTPCFFNTRKDGNGFVWPAIAEDIKEMLDKTPDVAAVVITSPDYFGRTAEVEKISGLTRQYGVKLIVDQAHGTHFAFSRLLPPSAVKYADVVVDSAHKTLPVYTGGAYLHVNGCELYRMAKLMRVKLHSTSPQYLTLASLDYARAKMVSEGEEAYGRLYAALMKFLGDISNTHYAVEESDDFTRLVINCRGFSGAELAAKLEGKGIYAEMSYGPRCVFILSPFNIGALAALSDALKEIELTERAEHIDFPPLNEMNGNYTIEGKSAFYPLEECESRICGTEIGVYPPGVPAVVRGEAITKEILNYLLSNRKRLFGLVDGQVCVVEEPVASNQWPVNS